MPHVIADGRRLHYEWHGPLPAAAPTLVFLHEGLGSVSSWRDFPADLAAATGCGALVYSRHGYGRSEALAGDRAVGYMHAEAERALPQVLRALEVREAILFGHSDGASIALVFASLESGPLTAGFHLHGLVLEAPHVFVEEVTLDSIAAARHSYETGDLRVRLSRHHADVDGAFWGWNRIWLDPAFRDWDLTGLLGGIEVPVLVLQCGEDPYGTAAQLEAIAAGVAGPVETVLLEGSGHAPHRVARDATLERAARFVRGLVAEAASGQER